MECVLRAQRPSSLNPRILAPAALLHVVDLTSLVARFVPMRDPDARVSGTPTRPVARRNSASAPAASQ